MCVRTRARKTRQQLPVRLARLSFQTHCCEPNKLYIHTSFHTKTDIRVTSNKNFKDTKRRCMLPPKHHKSARQQRHRHAKGGGEREGGFGWTHVCLERFLECVPSHALSVLPGTPGPPQPCHAVPVIVQAPPKEKTTRVRAYSARISPATAAAPPPVIKKQQHHVVGGGERQQKRAINSTRHAMRQQREVGVW